MRLGEVVALVILAHLVGDYIIQSHWMAVEKITNLWVAVLHGITYTIPFLFITRSPVALGVIAGTHIVIDHWRLAKYLIWFRNQLAPKRVRYPLTKTGFPPDAPDYLSVWLLIIADNVIHIFINIGSVVYL